MWRAAGGAIVRRVADPADTDAAGWEPGAPSLRAMAPGFVGGAAVPLAVYFLVRPHVRTDATALIIAGAFPAGWVFANWLRTRRVDPIGCIVLFGFLAGVGASELLGGSAFVLKVRDSAFTALFGIACLCSLVARRPMMFHIGKALSAGGDERRRAAYDELWQLPTVPRVFRLITVVWAVGLMGEAGVRVLLALTLPTGTFVAVSPAVFAVTFAVLFGFTVAYSRRARRRGEALLEETGQSFPVVA